MRRMIYIFVFSLLFMMVHDGFAQSNFWEQTGGPRSSYVTSLVIKSDETVFAGTERGVLRSTDGGETWEITGLSNVDVHALVITPNGYIFAGTAVAGMFRSVDNGLSWDSVNTGLISRSIGSLACNSDGELIAGNSPGANQYQIYRSTDYGEHWTLVAVPPNPCMVALNDSGHIFIGCRYSWGGGIGRSTDNGKSWVWISPPEIYEITRLTVNARGHVFAGTRERGIFRSTDNGATWDSACIGLPSSTLKDIVSGNMVEDLVIASGDTLFVATYMGGVFRSTNNGRTWTPTSLGSPVSALAAGPRGILFAGRVSVYRSSDYGDHWTKLNVPSWQDLSVTSLAVNHGDTLYAGSWGHGLFCSTDHGDSWREILLVSKRSDYSVGHVAVNARGHLFMPLSHDIGAQCFRSTDHGVHWVGLPIELWSIPPVFDDKGNIFAIPIGPGLTGVYRSTDNGDSWESVSTGLPDQNCYSLVINAGKDLFVGTQQGVYRSTNGGTMWTPVNNGLTGNYFWHLATNVRGDIFAGTESENRVFRSTTNGESWEFLYSLPTGIQEMVTDAAGNLFVATAFMGVYCNGVRRNSGLSDPMVRCLAMDSRGYIFAGTTGSLGGGRLFRSVQATTSVREAPAGAPAGFVLEQNYPNPFNPKTVVSYQLLAASEVNLVVYDVLGREVAVLVNERQTAGSYEVKFDARLPGLPAGQAGGQGGNLASGVYFYRLYAGGFVQSKKLLLLK